MPKRHTLVHRLDVSVAPRRWRLQMLSALYALNDTLSISKRWQTFLWTLILVETFAIDGACQHSGQCCQGIMLYHQGQALDRVAAFQDACQKDDKFKRFVPVESGPEFVAHYNCSCLGEGNLCTDYENRPGLCHAYPHSYFLDEGRLHQGCGYKIVAKVNWQQFWYRPLQRRVQGVMLRSGK